MAGKQISINNIALSLEDLLGTDYVEAVCEANAFLTGGRVADFLAIAREKVAFYPPTYGARLDDLLPSVGRRVVPPLVNSSAGASTTAFNKASSKAMAPIAASGFYRLGEDGRLYLITKSEHYHASLGHDFPGYRLLQLAQHIGITNATHNSTRGHITRLVERELVRVTNGLQPGDEVALDRVYALAEPGVLNRVINLETGSLAVEAGLKMMLTRFFRLDETFAAPIFAGRIPVFLVIADREGAPKANYHGTTVLTQVLRGMWPDLAAGLAAQGLYRVQPVMINDIANFQAALEKWDVPPYKVAGFFHEIVLMNYGGIRLQQQYLRSAYDLCRSHDVPILVDEIQSCIWSPKLFLFREYGLTPDFVSVGKGFPGGQYPASRIVFSAKYDMLNQFGALVTNGQEELAALAYLVTMRFVELNGDYVVALGDYFTGKLNELAAEFPTLIDCVEGYRHMGALFFRASGDAAAFTQAMNQAGYDVSTQAYKVNAPPAALTKIPITASYKMVDQFVGQMTQALTGLRA